MSAPTKILDVRPIPPREKHSTIFSLFDALTSGQSLQIVNDHDPMPLFYQMQAQRPNTFQWDKVEDGPEVWKVNIVRA
jgi:uncharacterized protein (DUF2249 family)